MYVVARRTKYHISERAIEAIQSPTSLNSTRPSHHHNHPTSQDKQVTRHPPSSIQMASFKTPPTAQTKTHNPRAQPGSQAASIQQSNPSFPDFSLQLYLNMAAENNTSTNHHPKNPLNWGHHLQQIGILQVDSRLRNWEQLRPSIPLTCTPLDPGLVAAEELDVYWEHISRFFNHIKLTQSLN